MKYVRSSNVGEKKTQSFTGVTHLGCWMEQGKQGCTIANTHCFKVLISLRQMSASKHLVTDPCPQPHLLPLLSGVNRDIHNPARLQLLLQQLVHLRRQRQL